MAHEVIEKHPSAEYTQTVDFTDELTGDTSISAGSAVTAIDSNGDPITSIIGTVSRSGMVLSAVLQAGTDGEDYTVFFAGRGSTTSQDAIRVIEMRVRQRHLGAV